MMCAPPAGSLRKLACFAVLSLIAHWLLIWGVPLQLPQRTTEPLPLAARLQPAEPLRPVQPRPRPPPRHATPTPAAAPVAETIATLPQVTAAPGFTPPPQSAPEPAALEPVKSAVPAAAPPTSEDAQPAPNPAPALTRRLPQRGEITYELYYGTDRFSVGSTLQTWSIKDGRYHLTSVSKTTGLAALFVRQSLDYVSTGRLTAGGLRPEFFGTARVRSGKTEAAAAKFDWNALTMTLSEPQRSVALPADAQDIVSFMYQLGLLPLAPGRIELPITNGWKLERYELEVGPEEQLQTPFGTLRAVPVKQVRRPGQESIELWLAPEYRWLPVRIRFFDRAGEPSGEQLVSAMRVSDE